MRISESIKGDKAYFKVDERLDTITASELEKRINDVLSGIKELVFDFSNLDYISSAGLKVLLAVQRKMIKKGKMIIKNVNETIKEVFEVTGFIDILTIE